MRKKFLTVILIICMCGMTVLTACDNSTDTPPANTPVKLVMSELSYDDTTKTVSWDKVANALSYQLKIGSGAYSSNGITANGNIMQFIMSESKSDSYTVSVVAKGDGTNYSDSDAKTKHVSYTKEDGGTTATVPGVPQGFAAEAGDGQVALSWSAPASDGGSAITGYQVSSNDGSSWTAASTGTSHTFTSLTNGTLYTFKVRAVNAEGNGAEATLTAMPVAATTTPTQLAAPNISKQSQNESTVVFVWDAVRNASAYRIAFTNSGKNMSELNLAVGFNANGVTLAESAGIVSLTITGLGAGALSGTVKAAGDGNIYSDSVSASFSATITITPTGPAPLSAPSVSVNDVTEGAVEFMWLAVPNASGYKVSFTGEGKSIAETLMTVGYDTNGITLTMRGDYIYLKISELVAGAVAGTVIATTGDSNYSDSASAAFNSVILSPIVYNGFVLRDVNGVYYEVVRTIGLSGAVTVPSNCNGRPITSIASYAFYSVRNDITSIVIPESITYIASGALLLCTELTSITIPFMGDRPGGGTRPFFKHIFGALSYDDNFTTAYPDNLTVTVTGGNIPDYAFYRMDKLKAVVIPDSATDIGEYAFYGCQALNSVTFGQNITFIRDYAFTGCNGLRTINIPDSVIFIGTSAFQGCSGTSVTIGNSVNAIENQAFYGISATSIVIPDSVYSIGWAAFGSLRNLVSITLPFAGYSRNSGASFFGYIFAANDAQSQNSSIPATLKNVTLTDCVTIEGNAFYGCTGIENLVLPDKSVNMMWNAFYGCSGLKSITLPKNSDGFTAPAFTGCVGLESFTVESGNTKFRAEGNCIINAEENILLLGCKTSVIPDSVVGIGQFAFYGNTSLESIVIPDTVQWITNAGHDFGPFNGCTSLTSITLPFLGEKADGTGNTSFKFLFDGAYGTGGVPASLKTVTLTKNKLSGLAFRDCTGITTVILQEGVTSIGIAAFSGCTGLTDITLPSSLVNIADGAFSDCTALKQVALPNSALVIKSFAFSGCTALEQVTLPDNLESIGSAVFEGCTGLISMSVPFVGQKRDGTGVNRFKDIFEFVNRAPLPALLSTVIVRGGLIGDYAFYDCAGLTNITLPDSISSIGNFAFYDCSDLVQINLPDSISSIGMSAFENCASLKSIGLPSGLTAISDRLFSGCTELTDISIPVDVSSIGNYAFYDCGSLLSIFIPAAVNQIGAEAFDNLAGTIVYYGYDDDVMIDSFRLISGAESLSAATVYYYSEARPVPLYLGLCWHYDTDGVTPLIWK